MAIAGVASEVRSVGSAGSSAPAAAPSLLCRQDRAPQRGSDGNGNWDGTCRGARGEPTG